MSQKSQQILLGVVLVALVLTAAYCSFTISRLARERAALKADYSAVNNITYGLLSVDAWKNHLIQIVSKRIDDFELNAEQEKIVRGQIESILHAVVDKADTIMHQKRKSVKAKLRKAVINALVNEKKIHEKVPELAQTIVREVTKSENKEKLKGFLLSKIEEYGALTYDSANDVARLERLLQKHNMNDLASFNSSVSEKSESLRRELYRLAIIEIGVVFLVLCMWFFLIKYPHVHNVLFSFSIVLALIVLVAGLTAPMIEIDARIKEMSFLLLGEKLIFNDQVIFYQSKSIVDVVHILVTTGDWDSLVVGVLILIFSIVFPIAKLVSSRFYFTGANDWRNSRPIKFFALKSGKWSMADVYVVAVFMAYIGFKSILDNQLNQLNIKTKSLASISTNETSLQPGFLLFICFVLFGLVLSTILEKIRAVPKMS